MLIILQEWLQQDPLLMIFVALAEADKEVVQLEQLAKKYCHYENKYGITI